MAEDEWLKPTPKDFGWALKQIKEGSVVCRAAWRGNACIFLIKGRTIEYNTFQKFRNNACQAFDPPKDVVIEDHIDGKRNGVYIRGVNLDYCDMLAEDWEIYKVEK